MPGINLQGGFGAGAAVDELHRILAERFREEVEKNNVAEAQARMAEAAARRGEDARQFDATLPVQLGHLRVAERGAGVAERGAAVNERGQNLAESQFEFMKPLRTAESGANVAHTNALTGEVLRQPTKEEQQRQQQVYLFGLQNAADVEAARTGNQNRLGQIRASGAEDRLTKAAPSDKTQETDEVRNLAASVIDNPDMLDKFTPSMRERVVSHIQGSGAELKSKGKQRAEESKQQALGLITEIENAAKDPINSGFAGAVGTKGPTSLLGALEKPMPGSKARTVADKIDQLTATLTIPRMEVMHGLGAMSDADFKNLKQSVTALNRGMGEAEFNKELVKIRRSLEGTSGPNLNLAPGSVSFHLDFDPTTGRVNPVKR